MIEREILVANTKTQKKSKLITTATTLGELKAAMDAENIDYSDMTFTEGISKTQLLDDATQLPSNLMYKGKPTNNLVILLTNTKKKIASGAMSRKEAYQAVKDNNLQEEVKKEFGRNFTQVPTDCLIKFIAEHTESTLAEEEEASVAPEAPEVKTNVEPDPAISEEEKAKIAESFMNEENDICSVDDIIADAQLKSIEDSIFYHVVYLTHNETLDIEDVEHLSKDIDWLLKCMKYDASKESFKTPKAVVSTSDGSINDDDINDMLNDLGI